MSTYRIFYLAGGGLLNDTEEVVSNDLVAAAKTASSKHPDMTAEIWSENRRIAVIRPSSRHHPKR